MPHKPDPTIESFGVPAVQVADAVSTSVPKLIYTALPWRGIRSCLERALQERLLGHPMLEWCWVRGGVCGDDDDGRVTFLLRGLKVSRKRGATALNHAVFPVFTVQQENYSA